MLADEVEHPLRVIESTKCHWVNARRLAELRREGEGGEDSKRWRDTLLDTHVESCRLAHRVDTHTDSCRRVLRVDTHADMHMHMDTHAHAGVQEG